MGTSKAEYEERVAPQCFLAGCGPESAGIVSHAHPGATVSDHANTTGQRGHLAEEVGICPKKDDVAMLAVISLGYDSPQMFTAS
jgi:hypothetical protein